MGHGRSKEKQRRSYQENLHKQDIFHRSKEGNQPLFQYIGLLVIHSTQAPPVNNNHDTHVRCKLNILPG